MRMRPGNFALGEANEQILARGYVSPIRASCELQLVPKAEVGPEGCGVGWVATERARGRRELERQGDRVSGLWRCSGWCKEDLSGSRLPE